MHMHVSFLFFTILISIHPTPRADAACTSGLRSGDRCCHNACGKCGGTGCEALIGGSSNCCWTTIGNSGRVCGKDPPPCVVVSSATTTTSTAVAASTASLGWLEYVTCLFEACFLSRNSLLVRAFKLGFTVILNARVVLFYFVFTKSPPNLQQTPRPSHLGPWKLLLRQTVPYYLNPASKWLSVNPTDPANPNYSVLDTLGDQYRNANGKFAFKLMWPKRVGKNYNIWQQSTNPVTEKTVKVPAGYEAIDVDFTTKGFGGLHDTSSARIGDPPSLLDGSVIDGKGV